MTETPGIRVTSGTGLFSGCIPDPVVFAARLAVLDRPGAHLWVYVAAWAAPDPRASETILNAENLLSLTGPGCYKCEQPFSNRLARKPCRGEIK